MLVLVKRDSATTTPVDLGEKDTAERLRALISAHGIHNITDKDGNPVEMPEEESPKKKKK